MTETRLSTRPASAGGLRRTWLRLKRRVMAVEGRALVWLVPLTLVMGGAIAIWPTYISSSILMIPLVMGSILLGPRHLPWFVVGCLVVLAFDVARIAAKTETVSRTIIVVSVVFIVGLIILLSSFRRSRLGVAGAMGESMLVDLRDRIMSQGELPDLPREWYAESALRSAGGTPFAGDFVVASMADQGRRLEVAVVDVSGKGEQAGTRALLLSGAFGGLLTALEPRDFLPKANEYLLRQNWLEGFATAIHLSLDLVSGDFEIRSAGHPPAVQLRSGSGKWTVHESEGPILGLIEDADFIGASGTMRKGDAVLLYTDGMVETPSRDIGLGIDKLVGLGERMLKEGFDNGARRLIEQLGSRNDDRALLLIHRH